MDSKVFLNQPLSINECLELVGNNGWYQFKTAFMLVLVPLTFAMHNFETVFIASIPKFTCADDIEPICQNSTMMCDKDNQIALVEKSYYNSSVITDFELYCDKESVPSRLVSIYFCGGVIGSVLFSNIADSKGRRVSTRWAILTTALASLLQMLASNWQQYAFLRFLIGAGNIGAFQSGICLLLESVAPQKRASAGKFYQISAVVGYALLPSIAHYIQDWRELVFFISLLSLPGLVFIYLFVDESLSYLVSSGEINGAKLLLVKIAKCNGYPGDFEALKELEFEQIEVMETVSWRKLFTHSSNSRILILSNMYIWFAAAFAYFGISLNHRDRR